MDRRSFLQFLGASGVVLSLSPAELLAKKASVLPHLKASIEDKLLTLPGIDARILISWGDRINPKQKFGFNNDFLAFHELGKDHGIMWVNHEYVNSIFASGPERSKENIDLERLEVGGSLLELKKTKGQWNVIKDSQYNRRLDATTEIPFAWDHPIAGSKVAIGTLAGCAGGKTPWGSVLSCEENYDMFYGDRNSKGQTTGSYQKWEKFYPHAPEHYGWVVEIQPKTGEAKKLISLGRCAHECAAVTHASNGKVVAYTGDDANDEHFYKFISDSKNSLERGKLYVANLEKGEWISLDINEQPALKKAFKNQTEVQIYLREAAKLVGATPLDRPEDIEFDPLTGDVLVTLTNNKPKKNFYGSILRIKEHGKDAGSLTFEHDTFLTGGPQADFACPDNMVFDPKGNLWFTTDVSGKEVNKGPYEGIGNNSLYVFLRSGDYAGKVIRIASAPVDAEFTGPCFSPDHKTLFLSVQHPGEESLSKDKPTSTWPHGGMPKPSVVTLQGELLDKIVQGKL